MAVKVVHILEVVEIDEKNPAAPAVIGLGDMRGQRLREQRAVGNPGQRIMLGEMAHAPLDGLALAQIHEAADADVASAIFDVAATRLDRDRRAIHADDLEFP